MVLVYGEGCIDDRVTVCAIIRNCLASRDVGGEAVFLLFDVWNCKGKGQQREIFGFCFMGCAPSCVPPTPMDPSYQVDS